jgi:uncharacterized protein with HEPN domain
VSPRSPEQRLNDIREAIGTIGTHQREAGSVGLERSSQLLLDGVVRQLAIIGEAAAHLPDEVTSRHPEVPWRAVKGMRLWLDHEYHRVDSDVVWRTVDDRLGPLAAAIERELSESG